jgi:ATP-binding cassette subfamily B protein
VGDLLVFLAYLTSLQAQFNKLTTIYGNLQKTNAGMDRALGILETPLEVTDKPGAVVLSHVGGRIRMQDVTFGHEVDRPVLRGISLEVDPGQIVAIVGPTGAGKSTLVSLVPRFFDPWTGQVFVDDLDVRDTSLASLRQQIAIVLQEPFLFRASIAENIAFARPRAKRSEIEEAARAANAHPFIERLPQGYDTILGDRGATLSGGERQRLSIARALLRDASILILDEPTSALDTRTEALLLEALHQLMKGRTTLIIAHRLSTIREADCILVLEDGIITERGRHDELLARGGRYARLHHSQFREATERGKR